MTTMAGAVPTVEHREEPYDPLAIPDADKSVAALFFSVLFIGSVKYASKSSIPSG